MIKIAVCDDEEIYLKQIENLIKEDKMSGYCDVYFFMRGKDVFASGIKFDIAFLDIELNEEKGLDTAMQLKTVNPDILILFVTNYTEYISEAFSVVPFQYLLKPIKEELFHREMQKAVEEVRRRKYLIDFCWNKAKYYIRSVDLMYIETINRKLKIVDGEGAERFSSGKIEEYEKKLYPYGFIRSHNSFLLNLNYVERTEGMQIYLRNKVILPISRKYLYGVRQAIAEKISGVMI